MMIYIDIGGFVLSCSCFFLKQKTAYEIYYGLVGSEMCIRDSIPPTPAGSAAGFASIDQNDLLKVATILPLPAW